MFSSNYVVEIIAQIPSIIVTIYCYFPKSILSIGFVINLTINFVNFNIIVTTELCLITEFIESFTTIITDFMINLSCLFAKCGQDYSSHKTMNLSLINYSTTANSFITTFILFKYIYLFIILYAFCQNRSIIVRLII